MKNLFILLTVLATVFYIPFVVKAQDFIESFHEEIGDREILTQIILDELTIWTRPSDGEPVYADFCRSLPHGCERQIATYVDYIFNVAYEQNLNPWLLAATAWHESRFNAFAESDAGAFGIFQLLRRGPASRGIPFVRHRNYRERCRSELGSCQHEIVLGAVFWLTQSIAHCGSIVNGLRMYNSGSCHGPSSYPATIFSTLRIFLEQAKNIREEYNMVSFVAYNMEENSCRANFTLETLLNVCPVKYRLAIVPYCSGFNCSDTSDSLCRI